MGKWDNYTVGSIPWINSRRERLKNCPFVHDCIKDKSINSILEIGGGELIEAQEIKNKRDVDYNIVDISKTFSFYAETKGFNVLNVDFEKHKFDKMYDMVYMNHVLEHMKDARKVLKKVMSIGKRYHICMFKWRFVGNTTLRPSWEKRKGFWSTSYNISEIARILGDTLKDIYITDKENKKIDWFEYIKNNVDVDTHRDGIHYLHLVGKV